MTTTIFARILDGDFFQQEIRDEHNPRSLYEQGYLCVDPLNEAIYSFICIVDHNTLEVDVIKGEAPEIEWCVSTARGELSVDNEAHAREVAVAGDKILKVFWAEGERLGKFEVK